MSAGDAVSSTSAAQRCADFVSRRLEQPSQSQLAIVEIGLDRTKDVSAKLKGLNTTISAVCCSPEEFRIAKEYWQHTGDGISSRRAEFCHSLFKEGLMAPQPPSRPQSSSRSPNKNCAGDPNGINDRHLSMLPATSLQNPRMGIWKRTKPRRASAFSRSGSGEI